MIFCNEPNFLISESVSRISGVKMALREGAIRQHKVGIISKDGIINQF